MKLENQVCDLEFSKKLKELGVKQESLFYWTELNGESFLMIVKDFEGESIPKGREDKFISAFTLAELGEMLPAKINTKSCYGVQYLSFGVEDENGLKYYPKYETSYSTGSDCFHLERAETEANCRAKMLIYLIENKLIKL